MYLGQAPSSWKDNLLTIRKYCQFDVSPVKYSDSDHFRAYTTHICLGHTGKHLR